MFSSFGFRVKLLTLLAALFLCSSVVMLNAQESPIEMTEIKVDSVKLPVTKRTFFYKIDPVILEGVEHGSPDSLREAMRALKQQGKELSEAENVLMQVASDMMKMAWPSEKITWETLPVSDKNPYIGALNSAKQGVFDSSTGNVDFLSTLLPSFVLFENTNNKSLYTPCYNAISSALSLNENSVIAKYLMAYVLEKMENYNEAEPYLESIYNENPNVEEIALAYVRILRKNGKADKASIVLKGVGEADGDLEILKQSAYVAFDMKDYASAEYYVARVLQQTPNDLDFVLFRAKILIEKKDYIHAVSLLDMYARYEDESLEYLLLRSKVQLDWSKNTSAATETIEKALTLYPDDVDALLIAAKISSITGSPVSGMYSDELVENVLNKQPNNKEAMNYALEGLIQRKNWTEAYDIAKKLIADENVVSDVIYKYVKVCIELGRINEAYDYVKEKHNQNPTDETILYAYILAYSEVGDSKQVIKYINSLIPTASNKFKSYLYYRRSFLQTNEEQVLADLRSCLISNPRNSDALFRLYEVYYDKGDYRKAQYYLRQVVAINPNDTSLKQLNDALTKMIK